MSDLVARELLTALLVSVSLASVMYYVLTKYITVRYDI